MTDEYQRLHLRAKWETYDRTVAGLRRAIREGRLKPYEYPGQIAWIGVNLNALEGVRRQLAEQFPDDEYVTRPCSSQPPEAELVQVFDQVDFHIRRYRSSLADGLDPQFKLELLPALRRKLVEADAIVRTFRSLYPDSPNVPHLRLRSETVPFELNHPETFSE